MKATFLIDNESGRPGVFECEWGLSIFIEHCGHRILLDAGKSSAFTANAQRMGIDLASVDVAVLSHAHYDHADGFGSFFDINPSAPCYLQASADENCYAQELTGLRYIGIKRGLLEQYANRWRRVSQLTQIAPEAWVLPHFSPAQDRMKHAAEMIVADKDGKLQSESFEHEQSLVLRCESGLVVFSCCSHIGPDAVLDEVLEAFPGQQLAGLIGGFHLYQSGDEEVQALAQRLRERAVGRIVTGHCSGKRAVEILKEELNVKPFGCEYAVVTESCSGLQIEIR